MWQTDGQCSNLISKRGKGGERSKNIRSRQITEGHLAVMNFKTIRNDPEFSEISSQTDDKNLNFQHPSQTKPQFSVACLTAQLSENAEYDDRTECVLGVGYEGDN